MSTFQFGFFRYISLLRQESAGLFYNYLLSHTWTFFLVWSSHVTSPASPFMQHSCSTSMAGFLLHFCCTRLLTQVDMIHKGRAGRPGTGYPLLCNWQPNLAATQGCWSMINTAIDEWNPLHSLNPALMAPLTNGRLVFNSVPTGMSLLAYMLSYQCLRCSSSIIQVIQSRAKRLYMIRRRRLICRQSHWMEAFWSKLSSFPSTLI